MTGGVGDSYFAMEARDGGFESRPSRKTRSLRVEHCQKSVAACSPVVWIFCAAFCEPCATSTFAGGVDRGYFDCPSGDAGSNPAVNEGSAEQVAGMGSFSFALRTFRISPEGLNALEAAQVRILP